MIIKSVDQVSSLTKGRLAIKAGGWVECSFSEQDVTDAAILILEKGDETDFDTQASVVAHAGNNYGLGAEAGGEEVYWAL